MLRVILLEDTDVPLVLAQDDDPSMACDICCDICICFTQEQVEALRNDPNLREDVIFPDASQ